MAAKVGTSTSGTADTGSTTIASSAKSTTSTNIILVAVKREGNFTVTGVTDTAGNTYTQILAEVWGTTEPRLDLWYAKNIISNASNVVTATFSGSATYRRIIQMEISGCDTVTPIQGTPTSAEGTGISYSCGSITISSTGILVISLGGYTTLGALTNDSTPTGVIDIALSDVFNGYSIVSSGSSVSPAAHTTSGNDRWTFAAVFFKDAAAGSSGTLARTNANDTIAASGSTTVVGTLARTTANDTSAATGSTTVIGTLAKTAANDTVVASGSVGSAATGTVNVTNQNDTSSASGTTTILGTTNVTNGNDTSNASGTVGNAVSGTANVTNGNDTSSASGTTTVLGTSNKTNSNDQSLASGTTTVVGTLNKTNSNDSVSASGFVGAPPANNTRLPATGVGT